MEVVTALFIVLNAWKIVGSSLVKLKSFVRLIAPRLITDRVGGGIGVLEVPLLWYRSRSTDEILGDDGLAGSICHLIESFVRG